jgi:hypothetical protein
MVPTIMFDDKIEVDDKEPLSEIKVGNIIAFRAQDPVEENKVIVHRVSAIIENGNNLTGNVILCAPIAINEVIREKTLLTKGDANECSIPGIDFPVTVDNYLGKVERVYNSMGLEKIIETNSDINWTSYENTTNGISFQYPENWRLSYSDSDEFILTLSNLPHTNTITIGISDQNHNNILNNSSLLNFANRNFTHNYGVTVLEPFTEKTINGVPAIIGRIAKEKLTDSKIESQVKDIILMKSKDLLYKVEYKDNLNNYDDAQRDIIWKRFILSFNISN